MILTVNSRPGATLAKSDPWQERAACADTDPELFFQSLGNNPFGGAFSLCSGCPVRDACLTAAMSAEEGLSANLRFGMFGGMTPSDRALSDIPVELSQAARLEIRAASAKRAATAQRIRRAAKRATMPPTLPADIQHGTEGGYTTHRKRGEDACDDCKAGKARAQRDRRIKPNTTTGAAA